MTRQLQLGDGFAPSIEIVTQKLGWIGTTGSGKTYGASKLAELLWEAHAQFVAIDPVGVWYGLRLAKDGKKPSTVTIPIFGGLHGDVPLEHTSGALVADLVVDRTLSLIIDISQFEYDTQKARFAADFADRFFFRKKAAPSAVHLFIEECQELIPENHQRGEERMLHAFVRMQKIGRNFGIGTSLITQRPQEVSKKALNLASTLFVFRTTGAHERQAIERWIKDKAIAGQDIASELPKLKTGRPHVWSPEWLQLSEVVRINEKRTFNASATPEVGRAAVARELASIDLDKIRKQMAATIEKAKGDDPRELKKQIADLTRQLQSKPTPASPPPAVITPKVKHVITDAALMRIDKHIARIEQATERARSHLLTPIERLTRVLQTLTDAVKVVRAPATPVVAPRIQPQQSSSPLPTRTQHAASPPRTSNVSRSASGLRRMLIACAQRPSGLTKRQLGLRAGLSSKTGTFANYLSTARRNGWITETEPFRITEDGCVALGSYKPLPTGRALYEYWLGELGSNSGLSRILRTLGDAWPRSMSKEDVGGASALSHHTGTFANYVSKLRGLELITVAGNELKASDELFTD